MDYIPEAIYAHQNRINKVFMQTGIYWHLLLQLVQFNDKCLTSKAPPSLIKVNQPRAHKVLLQETFQKGHLQAKSTKVSLEAESSDSIYVCNSKTLGML